MPDLTPVGFKYCKSIENFSTQVGDYTVSHGRSSGSYQYDFHCTCKGFKFRGKCKHIDKIKSTGAYCGWDQFVDGDDLFDGGCPCCGGETDSRLVGV